MTTRARSGHGTIVARNGVDIAELGDITMPGLSRNEFESLTQDEDIDSYVLGVMRRGAMTVAVNYLEDDPTHDHLTGLGQAIIEKTTDEYTVTFPSGLVWLMSGQVQAMTDTQPVDGKQAGSFTLRFSGKMMIGGVVVGDNP